MDESGITNDTGKIAEAKKMRRGILWLLAWLATFFVPYYITILYQCYQNFMR